MLISQHPETVGQPPLLFQTFTVHQSPIVGIMLSEKFLISGGCFSPALLLACFIARLLYCSPALLLACFVARLLSDRYSPA